MAARFTGVHRPQPALATRARWEGSSTAAAAPLTPIAPISEPPNQAATPRSCSDRATVVRAMRSSKSRSASGLPMALSVYPKPADLASLGPKARAGRTEATMATGDGEHFAVVVY